MDLSVVIVTSPSKSNPAITLIEQVIDSLDNNVAGVQDVPIIIVMDGFEVFGMYLYLNYTPAWGIYFAQR